MSQTDEGFQELLKQLRTDYLTALPAKFVVIGAQISAGDIVELRESFHKLKGTGKTYGVPEVSEVSAEAEEACLNQNFTREQVLAACKSALNQLVEIHKRS